MKKKKKEMIRGKRKEDKMKKDELKRDRANERKKRPIKRKGENMKTEINSEAKDLLKDKFYKDLPGRP